MTEGDVTAGADNSQVSSQTTQTPAGGAAPVTQGGAPAAATDAPAAHASPAADSPSAAGDPLKTPFDPDKLKPDAVKKAEETPKAWHEKLAEDYGIKDEAVLKKMARYGSPEEYGKAVKELERKLSSGERGKLGDNPTEDQIKDYREANGVPLDIGGYDTAFDLGDGYVFGDDDKKALTEKLIKPLHDVNAKPEIAKTAIKAYFDFIAEAQKTFKENDEKVHAELREEWGSDYDKNKGQIETLLSTRFGASADRLRGMLGADGKGFAIADKGVLNAFLDIANQLHPKGTLPPPAETGPTALDARIAEIEAFRKQDYDGYMSQKNVKMREELTGLLGSKQKSGR